MSTDALAAPEEANAALGAARSHVRQARRVVEELHDVVRSALAVVEDAEVDAARARTGDGGDFYLESTVEHLGRLRTRCDVICELSGELAGQLGLAAGAVADAAELSALIRREPELGGAAGRINQRSAALLELIDLARPLTGLLTGHADAALVASRETTTARPWSPGRSSGASAPHVRARPRRGGRRVAGDRRGTRRRHLPAGR